MSKMFNEKTYKAMRKMVRKELEGMTKAIVEYNLEKNKEKTKMPGNTIKINNRNNLSWYVGDSRMNELIGWLYQHGIKNEVKPEEIPETKTVVCEDSETKMKTKMDILNDWLDQLIFPGETSNFIQEAGVEEPSNGEIKRRFYLYTSKHKYMFVAIERENKAGYLGCQVKTRKQRAGEDWFRGNDLADGPFNKKTWNDILNSIIRYEIVKLTDYRRPETLPDEVTKEN